MFKKRGQVSFFVIIGMLILIMVGSFLFMSMRTTETATENLIDEYLETPASEELSEKDSEENMPFSAAPFEEVVQSCMEEVGLAGVYLLGKRGGSIYSYQYSLNAEYAQILYHYDSGRDVSHDKNSIMKEFSKFVEDSLPLCVNDFDGLEDVESFNFEYGKAKLEPFFNEAGISMNIEYPITITRGRFTETLSDFSSELPVRLQHILDVKDKIVSSIKRDGIIDLEFLSSFDVQVNLLPYDRNSMVYSIYDEKSNVGGVPFVFNFAVKREIAENE